MNGVECLTIQIRAEQANDIQTIHELTEAAFLEAPHTDHTEQFIVKGLRDSDALTLSLVAEDAGQLVGHVAVSPVTISDGSSAWYGLGPISVVPEKQGLGIGSQLMQAAIEQLKAIDAKGCVLLGDPNFYGRFGFNVYPELVLDGVPPEYFQALLLQGDVPQGSVTYHQAFAAQG